MNNDDISHFSTIPASCAIKSNVYFLTLHIVYTNENKLSVLNHFLNMTDFDTYLEKMSHLCMIAMS